MSETSVMRPATESAEARTARPSLKMLVGSGDKIGLFTLPFLVAGVALNYLYPTLLDAPTTSPAAGLFVETALVVGVVGWLWSVVLILTRVPKGELITSGPFALVKHPLYTSVGLLVIPALGLLLGSWMGLVFGLPIYIGVRRYAPAEERGLAKTFGPEWDAYAEKVWIPWL